MWLLQADADGHPLMFRITPGSIRTLGRASRAEFVVDRAMVSRLHCRLTCTEAGALVVEDLGSTNGTRVNGMRVEKVQLADGDTLGVGRVEFRLTCVER